MFIFRWVLSLPGAALVTTALFIFMAAMIWTEGPDIDDPKPTPVIKITPKVIEKGRTPPKPFKPELKKEPETIVEPWRREGGPNHVPTVPTGKIDPTGPGDYVVPTAPVIKIAPQYPESCRTKLAEGSVAVQFDVTPEGNVVNPRIIESSHRCFERTVISTVSKWKYPPSPSSSIRYGFVEYFSFELVD